MPIKLNWTRGKSLGLSLIYLGIMGLLQVIFVTIAQYWMKIGSKPIVAIIPIGVSFATFYSVIILFESNTTMKQYRKKHTYSSKDTKIVGGFKQILKNPYIKPLLFVVIIFSVLFAITCLFLIEMKNKSTVFIIADNIGAIGCLIYSIYRETRTSRRVR